MAGMSGSDIKEACRDAAMGPVREFIRNKRQSGQRMDALNPEEVRGLRTEDFFGKAGGLQLTEEIGRARGMIPDSEASDVDEMEDAAESMD